MSAEQFGLLTQLGNINDGHLDTKMAENARQ